MKLLGNTSKGEEMTAQVAATACHALMEWMLQDALGNIM